MKCIIKRPFEPVGRIREKDKSQWLYKQEGQERTLYARFGSPQRAKEFMQTLVDWDATGGNDGGIEK